MGESTTDLLHGTLDLLVLKTLETLGRSTVEELPGASIGFRKTFCI